MAGFTGGPRLYQREGEQAVRMTPPEREQFTNAKETIVKRNTIWNTFAVAALALGMAAAANVDNKGCTVQSLMGTYAQRDSGFLTAPPSMAGPYAGVSTVIFDGKGTVTATGMASLNGNILAVTSKGTYTVNPDCTGTYTVQISPVGITGHSFFVIAESGNELDILPTDSPIAATCVARRQFPVGDWRQ